MFTVTIIAVGVTCLLFGFILGACGTLLDDRNKKDKTMDLLICANKNAADGLQLAIASQREVITDLLKDKEALLSQLEDATEACAEMESELSEDEDDSDDEGSEDSDGDDSNTTTQQATTVKKTLSKATSSDKLIVLESILKDCESKNEQVSPSTLLGILRHSLEKE